VVALTSLLVVPLLKSRSLTSCPWDLAEFGGKARQVSHWAWGIADGGPGHCFPSGHATTGFAFFAGYFLLRELHPKQARAWLAAVCASGMLFGGTQVVRGAHYISHIIWTAWICWALCTTVTAALSTDSMRIEVAQ
jgi:membrane-associated PAP2 superfamily phosphatase